DAQRQNTSPHHPRRVSRKTGLRGLELARESRGDRRAASAHQGLSTPGATAPRRSLPYALRVESASVRGDRAHERDDECRDEEEERDREKRGQIERRRARRRREEGLARTD